MTTTWIALLRGINVGGHNKIAMAELRALCGRLGLEDVATYIQSGNVVFRAGGDGPRLAGMLEEAIRERFGHSVPVVLRTAAELERAAERHPFVREGRDLSRLHIGFLAEEPPRSAVDAMPAPPPGPEEFTVVGGEVFLHYPAGMGRSKLTTTWFDRALGTTMTVRNVRTVRRLLEMAGRV